MLSYLPFVLAYKPVTFKQEIIHYVEGESYFERCYHLKASHNSKDINYLFNYSHKSHFAFYENVNATFNLEIAKLLDFNDHLKGEHYKGCQLIFTAELELKSFLITDDEKLITFEQNAYIKKKGKWRFAGWHWKASSDVKKFSTTIIRKHILKDVR